MKTVFEVQAELELLRANGDFTSFGIFYQSKSIPSNKYYSIVKNETEFENLKKMYYQYDYVFNKLAV